ncbi:uncharacterized protein LOC123556791 [Mercenaria mercenaria]|uniref:uncharacterized protein LOC123556791 n=1 Tax=Mercenaria mercenaria TaxID=6596 RepID=UPI001E1D977D|nr:uncharacterized protein LOC123556791 [Mercenaria mercenaria]
MALQLKPSEIYYSQNSISCSFTHNNKLIGETLDDLCERRISISHIPPISVTLINGRWVSADNRRLWVFRQLEILGKCTRIPVIQKENIRKSKQTSTCGGTDIRLRGHSGSHYNQWQSKSFEMNTDSYLVSTSYWYDVDVDGDPGGRWYKTDKEESSPGSDTMQIIAKCSLAIGTLLMMVATKQLIDNNRFNKSK